MTLILHQAHGSTFVFCYDERDAANFELALGQIAEWAERKLDGFDSEDADAMANQVVSAQEPRP